MCVFAEHFANVCFFVFLFFFATTCFTLLICLFAGLQAQGDSSSSASTSERLLNLTVVAGNLLSGSLAPSTVSTYCKNWDKFNLFAASLSRCPLPASVNLVALFIAHLVSLPTPPKPSAIASTLSAISFFHKVSDAEDPTSAFLIRKILKGCFKANPSADTRFPVSVPMLYNLIDHATTVTSSSYDACLLQAMFSLMFHGLLRIGEVTRSPHNLLYENVSISHSISLTFLSFKHDKGSFTLNIPQSSSRCPVQLLSTYVQARGTAHGPLFCHPDLTPLSAARFRSMLRLALLASSLESYHITPHSFRIGGATYAASLGYSATQIQAMGRWNSSAADRYIRIQAFTVPTAPTHL